MAQPLECPHCNHALSEAEIRSLNGRVNRRKHKQPTAKEASGWRTSRALNKLHPKDPQKRTQEEPANPLQSILSKLGTL